MLVACGAPTRDPQQLDGSGAAPTSRAPGRSPRATDAPLPNRDDFARAIAEVKPKMGSNEVTALLGPPDDVLTAEDGITASRTTTVWRYGTDGHRSLATLGTVHLLADGTVQYVFGAEGAPPTMDLPEKELRRLLRILDAVPSYEAPANPLRIVQAVNALQPLGKDVAVAVLAEYLRVASPFDDPGREGVFHVLRTLFDPPDDTGVFPEMFVGAPTPEPPKDPKAAPRFPIVIVDDIPFVAVTGYALGGLAEPPEHHLEWMRAHAELRRSKLSPTSTPILTLERMVGLPTTPWLTSLGLGNAHRTMFIAQGAKVLEHVIPGPFNPALPPDDAWKVLDSERGVAVVWSEKDDDYRLAPR